MVAWERIGRGKLLLHCGVLGGARRFGAHRGRRGTWHIVAAARLQLVTNKPVPVYLKSAKFGILLHFG